MAVFFLFFFSLLLCRAGKWQRKEKGENGAAWEDWGSGRGYEVLHCLGEHVGGVAVGCH